MLYTKIPCDDVSKAADFLLLVLRAKGVVKKDHFVGFEFFDQLYVYELQIMHFKPARIGMVSDDSDDFYSVYQQLLKDGCEILRELRTLDENTPSEYLSYSFIDPFNNVFDVNCYANHLVIGGEIDEIE